MEPDKGRFVDTLKEADRQVLCFRRPTSLLLLARPMRPGVLLRELAARSALWETHRTINNAAHLTLLIRLLP